MFPEEQEAKRFWWPNSPCRENNLLLRTEFNERSQLEELRAWNGAYENEPMMVTDRD